MNFKPQCRCCNTEMKPGYLINDPAVIEEDGIVRAPGQGIAIQRATITVTGCWKCPACGHSFIPRSNLS